MPRKATSPRKADTKRRAAERLLIYRMQAEMCRTLGHPERLAIIDLLKAGELPTAELLRRSGIGKVNLSRHLTSLKQVGLVASRPRGREALYRLAFCEIGSACAGIREVLELRLRQNARLASALAGANGARRRGARE
jgi:DNA-binding transcriptional ArsR family regulator